ncbi:molybdopterin-dependent oxidoreductase [Pseudoroseomonas globiformis]|uniref:Molybdopterin-dependent oxidoreductase n=1 Tax=Teichococcus globiformis TaxID=2307229 RepID=A0ABV7FY90_9PROT
MIARRTALVLGLGIASAWPGRPVPAAVPAPPARPALRVTGLIGGEADAGERAFSMDELEALGSASFVTSTPWTKGSQRFTGVPLKRLLDAVECRGTMLHAFAINDYRGEIPVSDAESHGPLLATRLDGRPMRVRDFGPIWLVYPWSERPDLDRPSVHRRSVWQLVRIEVR